MTGLAVRVGDVVRIAHRYGPLDQHVVYQCPVCHRIISRNGDSCRSCGARYSEVSEGFVEVVDLGG